MTFLDALVASLPTLLVGVVWGAIGYVCAKLLVTPRRPASTWTVMRSMYDGQPYPFAIGLSRQEAKAVASNLQARDDKTFTAWVVRDADA